MEQMINEIKRLYQELYDIHLELFKANQDPYESAETKELHIDLASMQGEYPVISANRDNPFFKSNYADLDVMMKAVQPLMKKYGFSTTSQEHFCVTFGLQLRTRLRHKSGQWIETRSPLKDLKPGDQEYGKMLSYRTRYSIKSLLGITISKDPADDDGEDDRKAQQGGKYQPQETKRQESTYERITLEQEEQLERALDGFPDLAKDILTKSKMSSLADIPKAKFYEVLGRIDEIKRDTDKAKRLATAHNK